VLNQDAEAGTDGMGATMAAAVRTRP
jgi:hypothetical protein